MQIQTHTDFREILKSALSERLSQNARYSLRAFARDLGLSPAQVSLVLSGRKGMSPATAEKIGKKLNWSVAETEYFVSLVTAAHGRSEASKTIAKKHVATLQLSQSREDRAVELQLDAFRIISEWYHFPILELLKTKMKKTPREIAKRLNLNEIEVQLALSRLERLELIDKTSNGYRVNQEVVISRDNMPSDALRKFHAQVMEKAKVALLEQPVEERYFRSLFFPIKKSDLPKAQKSILGFFQKFVQTYSSPEGEEIYALSSQFFRVTEKDSQS